MLTIHTRGRAFNSSFEKQKLADEFARLFLDYYRSAELFRFRPDPYGCFQVQRVNVQSDNEWIVSRSGDWSIRFSPNNPTSFSVIYRFADKPHTREHALIKWWSTQHTDFLMSFVESGVSNSPALLSQEPK